MRRCAVPTAMPVGRTSRNNSASTRWWRERWRATGVSQGMKGVRPRKSPGVGMIRDTSDRRAVSAPLLEPVSDLGMTLLAREGDGVLAFVVLQRRVAAVFHQQLRELAAAG